MSIMGSPYGPSTNTVTLRPLPGKASVCEGKERVASANLERARALQAIKYTRTYLPSRTAAASSLLES
jgi:hypothetical protein